MGQKVNPIGFRLGIPSQRKKIYTNPLTQSKTDVFHRKTSFNFPPRLNSTEKSQTSTLHQNFIIKNLVEEIFNKSGQFISHFFIEESQSEITIKADIFHRQGTSNISNFAEDNSSPLLSRGSFLSKLKYEKNKDNLQFENRKLKKEKPTLRGNSRKLTWTNRRLSWRPLTNNDLKFFSQFIEKTITGGRKVNWKIRLLNGNLNSNSPLMRKLFRNMGRSKNQPFFADGLNILTLVLQEPQAPLLAKYIAQELSQLRKHSSFIQFIKEGLNFAMEDENPSKATKGSFEKEVNLEGFLIQIKGRINGSDRSRRLKSRKGNVPLHTINASLDQAFSEAITSQGKCSVKVWLKQA